MGTLEDNAGNILTEGFIMAGELNKHFSSVFCREDISSLLIPVTKLNGPKSEMLGQLIITPEEVASKISNRKKISHPE